MWIRDVFDCFATVRIRAKNGVEEYANEWPRCQRSE
jgi:hypothetical protein